MLVHFATTAIAGESGTGYNPQPNQKSSQRVLVQVLSSGWVVNTKRWADAHFFFVESF
jgi:acetyl esterase/lipase